MNVKVRENNGQQKTLNTQWPAQKLAVFVLMISPTTISEKRECSCSRSTYKNGENKLTKRRVVMPLKTENNKPLFTAA